MRVIGGKYKSRVLSKFDGEEVRPTADRVKESLFNILALKIAGARVLDVFSGSGALGIECLSRGAKEVVFNDFSADSIKILSKNLAALKIGKEEARVLRLDYAACLSRVDGSFELIFLDPPYRFDYGKTALQIIAERGLLAPNGIAVYERDRRFEDTIEGLEKFDERKYGKTYLSFFKRSGE